jgi:hypothetical protein
MTGGRPFDSSERANSLAQANARSHTASVVETGHSPNTFVGRDAPQAGRRGSERAPLPDRSNAAVWADTELSRGGRNMLDYGGSRPDED